jgi:hypothetical protein
VPVYTPPPNAKTAVRIIRAAEENFLNISVVFHLLTAFATLARVDVYGCICITGTKCDIFPT